MKTIKFDHTTLMVLVLLAMVICLAIWAQINPGIFIAFKSMG